MMKMIYSTIVAILLVLQVSFCSAETIFPPGIDLRRYTKHYVALQEPPIWPIAERDNSITLFRFLSLWIRSNPSLFRIDVDFDGNKTITFKKTSGDPGSLTTNTTIPLLEKDFITFTNLLERADFWNLPHSQSDHQDIDEVLVILEAIENGRYHVVERQSDNDIEFTLFSLHLYFVCFPDTLIPPLSLLETLYHIDLPRGSLSFDPEEWDKTFSDLDNEEQFLEKVGQPDAINEDADGKTYFHLTAQVGILAVRFDAKGIQTTSRYYPRQRN